MGIIAYFGYNYLTSKVSNVVFQMESSTIEFMDLLEEPVGKESKESKEKEED